MTLQEQFNSIKSGKGNKDQFLKQARQTFPQYLTKFLDFDTSVNILKSKQLINEAIGGVVTKGFNITDWKQIFEAEVKAEEKTISKEAEDANRNMYDNKNVKNADNINFNEILRGYLAELGDPKNAGKTGDELKDIVVKNLGKDPLHYTKDGMFGVKGVGYTTEAPGLGEPKAPKGKHKASGYGDIEKEVKVKANVQDSLGDKEAKDSMPKKVKEMTATPQNSAGVKKMKMPGAEKKMKLQEGIIDINGKSVEAYTQNGDKSYSVTYNDGTKEVIMVSNNAWDKINDLNVQEGIHDRDITSASHTNVKQLPGGFWDNIKDEDASKLFDYHERTGNLPAGLSSEKYDEIMKKFNISRMDDSDVPFKNMTENEAVYAQISDLEHDLMMADTNERKAEIEAKIKALEAGLNESKIRSVIAKIIQEELKK